jgi:hypothetical protein
VPKIELPMPTTIASTISLMPDEMTLPSTRSARKGGQHRGQEGHVGGEQPEAADR